MGQYFLAENESHIYPNVCAKFGCGPTVVSKKKGGGTDRQTDRQRETAALYSRYQNGARAQSTLLPLAEKMSNLLNGENNSGCIFLVREWAYLSSCIKKTYHNHVYLGNFFKKTCDVCSTQCFKCMPFGIINIIHRYFIYA